MTTRVGTRVKMTVSGTPGAGDITLGSNVLDATNGDFQTFAGAGFLDGDLIRYFVTDGHAWGHEQATYVAAGPTLSGRTHVSSSSGSLLTLTSAALVFSDLGATDISQLANTEEGAI